MSIWLIEYTDFKTEIIELTLKFGERDTFLEIIIPVISLLLWCLQYERDRLDFFGQIQAHWFDTGS